MISIVVPTYHEAGNISLLLNRIRASLTTNSLEYEVIIVDDDSRDGTDAVVAKLRSESHPVRLITRQGERGLSSAVLCGFQEARGDILVCMDADLSHPPERIPHLVQCLANGKCEFVVGSRYVRGGTTDIDWGVLRWLNSKVATLFARPFTRAKDPMSGFFALHTKVFNRAEKLNPIGYKIGLELIVKCRCNNVKEIPIHFAKRQCGESKMNLREQIDYLKHLKRLADFRFGAVSRFLQFCTVGFSGMIIDLTAYAILLAWGTSIYIARGIAISIAMTWNFFLNRKLTFSDRRDGQLIFQYLGFVASSAIGAIVSWTIATIFAPMLLFFREHLILAAVAGILTGTASNFTMCTRLVFRQKNRAARDVQQERWAVKDIISRLTLRKS